jgi:hypothetical protein
VPRSKEDRCQQERTQRRWAATAIYLVGGRRAPAATMRKAATGRPHCALATAVTVAPGSRASDMIRSFCSADQLRRRSTVEIISDHMCLGVLKHVNKDSMIHQFPPRSARRQCRSPERTLTDSRKAAKRKTEAARHLVATELGPRLIPERTGSFLTTLTPVIFHSLEKCGGLKCTHRP